MEDIELGMPETNNHLNLPASPRGGPPSLNASQNSINNSYHTEDASDIGADKETIGMRYACPNLGCTATERPVYSNPQYANSGLAGNKKRYPTLDRPPSRAPSRDTVQDTASAVRFINIVSTPIKS